MVVLTSLIAWLIPDVPLKVKKQIRREAYIANEIIIQTELVKAQDIRENTMTNRAMGRLVKDLINKDKDPSNGSELRHRSDGQESPDNVVQLDDVSVSKI